MTQQATVVSGRPRHRATQVALETDHALYARIAKPVPKSLRSLFRGPRSRLKVSAEGAELLVRQGRSRPTDIVIADDLVLSKRLVLPAKAVGELRSAVTLLVKSQTPFEPDEVIAGVKNPLASEADGLIAYTVTLLPRKQIQNAFRQHRIGSVGTLRIDDASPVDFSAAFRPMRQWTRIAWILPAVVCLLALVGPTVLEGQRAARYAEELRTSVAEELDLLREASSQRDELAARTASAEVVTLAVRALPSAASILSALQRGLSAETEVLRIEFREGVYRIAVRVPDALQLVRKLSSQRPSLAATLDGTITRDPTNGVEAAVLKLDPGTRS